MTSVNDRQVGGSHYRTEYQHWDFATDLKMPYVIGCATKYVARWRKKNGIEDLEKAIHYLQKAEELKVAIWNTVKGKENLERFCVANFPDGRNALEAGILYDIFKAQYSDAIATIRQLIEDTKPQVSSNH